MFKRGTQENSGEKSDQIHLRLLPGVIAVLLQWLITYILPLVVPETKGLGVMAGLFGGLVVIVWWAFFSRAPRFDRWSAVVVWIIALFVTSRFLHESIATAQLGLTYFIYAIPILSLAFVVWAVVSRSFSERLRRVSMVVTIVLASGVWTLFRTVGMTSDMGHDFAWRWTETSEDQLLIQAGDEPTGAALPMSAGSTETDWPGFRGPDRNGIIRGVRIETGWSLLPPEEMWRQSVGPGWSSFAVRGNLFYTQEQRGEDEVVTCYNVANGKSVWRHRDAARFLGADANPGPRATPTLSNGLLFTFGATGILNVLDAADGAVIWSRDAASDAGMEVPVWGFASSPLVVENVVIVHVGSTILAYDLKTGDQRWSGTVGFGYSSPHLLKIDGVTQVLLQSGVGTTSFLPSDGTILWEYLWDEGDRILQPAMTTDGDILLCSVSKGLRRLGIENGPGGWTIEERWTSTRLKSNFNDFVVHKGFAYGFDGTSLTCIDIKDGKRNWKGGRYGGQLVLLADQDVLLVLSEKGELALVPATPGQFTELERFSAIKGKTWNHPVLVGDVLLVRNGQEMVAYRLAMADG